MTRFSSRDEALDNALRATYAQAEALRIGSRGSQLSEQLRDEGVPTPPLASFCLLPWEGAKSLGIDWAEYRRSV